eukprot:CAMPEP_0197533652 /NCGR_PEP_ID=MMETSP1318-20131121/44241_1 /TAXON_ID=552666 /ORGANISM="Partenskyella glossopodia, Strain RCC365" /LENGTH=40 /DNA_ID= /DNA_START= /DNA_END= /DNA_ORIENTATION=
MRNSAKLYAFPSAVSMRLGSFTTAAACAGLKEILPSGAPG